MIFEELHCTILPCSSSKYFYSWWRLSNLLDLSFECHSLANKRKATILFPSPLMFLQLPMVILTKTYIFCLSTFPKSILWRESIDLFVKIPFFWMWKQLFAIHFLLVTGNVCPLAIPKFIAYSMVSDYWQIIHWLKCECMWKISGYWVYSFWEIVPLSDTKFLQFVQNQNELAWCFQQLIGMLKLLGGFNDCF